MMLYTVYTTAQTESVVSGRRPSDAQDPPPLDPACYGIGLSVQWPLGTHARAKQGKGEELSLWFKGVCEYGL